MKSSQEGKNEEMKKARMKSRSQVKARMNEEMKKSRIEEAKNE